MTKSDLELLKASIDNLVRVHCLDGEVFVGKTISVSEEEQDLIYDLISTNHEYQYEKTGQNAAYLIRFDEIDCVERFQGS
jgi:hypothetical protein